MGHWGVHLDGGNADYPSGTTTVAMVQEDTDDNMTLYAAPGKLTKLTQEDVTLKDGEKFRVWDGTGETEVFYRAAGCGSSGFTTKSDGTCTEYNYDNLYWKVRSGGNNYIEPGDRMWSEMNRAEVILKTLPNAVMFKRDRVTASSTSPNVSGDLNLTCVGDCPKGKPLKTEYENNSYREFCMAPFNQDWLDGHGNPGNSSGCSYTFKSSGDANAPLTLFRGSDPVVLYNDATTPMNTSHKSEGRHYHIGSGRYVISGEVGTGTCAADDNPAATNNIWNCPSGVFEWGTGLERWDQYYYAKYDNNSFVTNNVQKIKNIPIIVIGGSEDTVVPNIEADFEALSDQSNLSVQVIEGADHFFRDLYADDAAAIIVDLIESI